LAAAVRGLVHHSVAALREVDRLEDVEVERILDVAASVRRREPDVDDDRVLVVVRIELAERLADDALVLPHAWPGIAAEGRRLRQGGIDLDARDSRLRGRGEGRGQDTEKQSFPHFLSYCCALQ